jgi:hypothetical protein
MILICKSQPRRCFLLLILQGVLLSALAAIGMTIGADDQPVPARRIMRVFVLGEDGQPLAGARVHASIWARQHRHPNVLDAHIPDQGDSLGNYKWTWAPDDEVTFSFGKEEYQAQEGVRLTANPETQVVTMKRVSQ